jgi:3-mercaptopyruvate sulfurtransferase SseA
MNSTKSRRLAVLVLVVVVGSLAIIGTMRLTARAGAPQASDDVRRITPDEVRALLKQNKAIIVDVRGKESYDGGHIKGALSIPFNEIEERSKELPHNKTIVAYCS